MEVSNSCLPTHPPRGPDCPFGNNATLCAVGTVPLSPGRAAARHSLGCIVGCGGFGGCDHTRLEAWAMCCVHVGRLEMPSAHLSRTMYRPECVSGRVFSILKLQLGRLCAPSWEAAFLLGCSSWQGRACQLLGCSRVTLKCPLCSATVPWSELRLPCLLAVKTPGCRWASHLLVPAPGAQALSASLCSSLRIKEETKERGETREQLGDHR